MISLSTVGQNFVLDADIIREIEVQTMRKERQEGIPLHGSTIRGGISIIMNTGWITVWMEAAG